MTGEISNIKPEYAESLLRLVAPFLFAGQSENHPLWLRRGSESGELFWLCRDQFQLFFCFGG
jgi:hypothetical protein